MRLKLLLTVLFIGSMTLIGCGGGGGDTTTSDTIAPIFSTSDNVSISENQINVMTVHATDTSTIIYSISAGDDKSLFSINSSSGDLTFNTAPDFENPTDTGSDNIYEVIVTATDTSINQTEQMISVAVTDVDEGSSIVITEDYQVESLGFASVINRTVSLGNTPKSLYLVLSNSANVSGSSTIIHNAKVAPVAQSKAILPASLLERPVILRAPQYVQDFTSQIRTLLSKAEDSQLQAKTIAVPERMKDIEGTSKTTFYLTTNTSQPTEATARKVVSDIPTVLGNKTLNIWVSNDSFDGPDCTKSRCVTQSMVDALANNFLSTGVDNDIYDWVTNIYGEEWEADNNGYSNLISANDEITILLTDIDGDDSANGGVVGFFWSKDNFLATSVSGSNERVMFYIDAVMFANGVDTWDIDDFWPKELISTLAHEFQHMINFYQKYILLDSNTDTWINEMLSESTEDLVATKIRHIGPRGVAYTDGSAGDPGNTLGRYPLFNANNTLSLTTWTNQLEDYSNVNAFGAYLLRNYGGAALLHDIMHNGFEDEQAVVDAVNKSANGSGKTFSDLLSEWGVAVMLSDHDNLVNTPFYNTGDFTYSDYNGIIYDMGSINFFNYSPPPTIYTTSGTVQPEGNYYYKIGENLTGDINISLELNGQTEATLIAK